LCAAYPVLEAECLARVNAATKGAWQRWGNHPQPGQPARPASLAWGFHSEAVNLWAQRGGGRSSGWDFLWVLEDDVGCTGDLLDCLAAYASDRDADLIGAPSTPAFRIGRSGRAIGSRWCWARAGSDAFLARVPEGRRLHAAEHVQRFSRRLLDGLHELAAREPGAVAAWSEMGTPTLCDFLGLRAAPLRAGHIGEPFAFDGRVTRDEWARRCAEADVEAGRTPKLFHALKW